MKHISSFLLLLALTLSLTACKSQHSVSSVSRSVIVVDSHYDSIPNVDAVKFLSSYKAKVDSIMSPVVGHSAKVMIAERPESPLSNLLSDILVCAGNKYGERPDFGIYNIGGMRASLPQGEVTFGHILEVAPFENKICFFTMQGSDVMGLFREIAALKGEGVSHSVKLKVSAEGKLLSASINDIPVDESKTYRVASIDYLAEGNDHMPSFKRHTDLNSPKGSENDMRNIISSYFREKEQQGIIVDSDVEGRIDILGMMSVAETNSGDRATSRPSPLLADITHANNTLVILHTNDTHSTIEPVSKFTKDKRVADRGGFVRRAAVVEEQRSLSPDLLLFDSGDFSQGSTYYTLFKGDVEVGLMNIMRYDAATLGNHEFDFGLDNLARLARLATFPIVCTNCDFSGTPAEGLIKPYAIVRRHGMKIGVIGLCPKIDGLIMRENHEGVTYLDPIESARTTAKMLKQKEKCDLVVCLSHLGWKLAPDMDDNQLIPSITDIDIVLGGHSHTYFKQLEYVNDADGKPVAVNQNGKHGAFVGRLEMELKAK